MRETIGHVCIGVGARNRPNNPYHNPELGNDSTPALLTINDNRSQLQPQLDQYAFTKLTLKPSHHTTYTYFLNSVWHAQRPPRTHRQKVRQLRPKEKRMLLRRERQRRPKEKRRHLRQLLSRPQRRQIS
jgi:hypothetical protein